MAQTHFFGGNSDVGGVKRRFQFSPKSIVGGVFQAIIGLFFYVAFFVLQDFSHDPEFPDIVLTLCIIASIWSFFDAGFSFLKTGHYLEVCEYGIRGKGGVGNGFMSNYKWQSFAVRYEDIVSAEKNKAGMVVTTSGGTYILAIRDMDEAIRSMEERRKKLT
ncbi:MAG: hypothetical protein ACI3W7_05475 [Oscillospiraceae bacterium]